MSQHGIPHDRIVRTVLHSAGAHDGVKKVHMWHHAGREPVLQHKDFGFQAVAVPGGLHIL